MIDVKMGEGHGIYGRRSEPQAREVLKERAVQVRPFFDYWNVLVVADPPINDDPAPLGLDCHRLYIEAEVSCVVNEVRLQPGNRKDVLWFGIRQYQRTRVIDRQFNQLRDRDVTDLPTVNTFMFTSSEDLLRCLPRVGSSAPLCGVEWSRELAQGASIERGRVRGAEFS
jgi:hypothetical protein